MSRPGGRRSREGVLFPETSSRDSGCAARIGMHEAGWDPSIARRHGEPFPLPLRDSQLSAQDSWRPRQVARSVCAVNRLAAARTNGPELAPPPVPPHRRETAVQADMLDGIERRVEAYGPPPSDLSDEGALCELVGLLDLYSQEPKNLGSYRFELIAFLNRPGRARPLAASLPPEARLRLRDFETYIEKSPAELEMGPELRPGFKP